MHRAIAAGEKMNFEPRHLLLHTSHAGEQRWHGHERAQGGGNAVVEVEAG